MEIKALIEWQEARKKWHSDKTRQKMAAEGTGSAEGPPGMSSFRSSDFGLHEADLMDLRISDEDEDIEDDLDPIQAERRRRKKAQDRLRRSAGEPVKPDVTEVLKMKDPF